MPTWDEILKDVSSSPNIYDITRRKYIRELSDYTGRNTIIYYSAYLQKPQLSRQGVDFGINDGDKTGLMTVISKLDKKKGLDLFLHTPGGNISATESIVSYLRLMFGNDIRAIVPQIAMSAGTMMACSCKSIVMGKQSNLGPIDPQIGMTPAQGILDEFERIKDDVKKDPKTIIVWREILSRYNPTLIGECEKAIKWAADIVEEWLNENMFSKEKDKSVKVKKILSQLSDHSKTLSHSRHLGINEIKSIGLKVEELEKDQKLQDLVLSVHHATIISLTQTHAVKIMENNIGKSYVQISS